MMQKRLKGIGYAPARRLLLFMQNGSAWTHRARSAESGNLAEIDKLVIARLRG